MKTSDAKNELTTLADELEIKKLTKIIDVEKLRQKKQVVDSILSSSKTTKAAFSALLGASVLSSIACFFSGSFLFSAASIGAGIGSVRVIIKTSKEIKQLQETSKQLEEQIQKENKYIKFIESQKEYVFAQKQEIEQYKAESLSKNKTQEITRLLNIDYSKCPDDFELEQN